MIERAARFFRLTVRELTIALVLFAVSVPAVTLRLYASDEVQYYAYLRSLWFDRDVSFENEYRHFHESGVVATPLFLQTFLELSTDTGLRPNFATMGSAVLWAPSYAVADLAVRIRGGDTAADGYAKPYIAAVCVASAIYGFIAVLLSIRIARTLLDTGARAGVLVWIGTPLLFYMYVAPGFAHATSAFAVALFITAWLRARARWTLVDVALLGAAAGLMAMVREQDAFFAIGPSLDFALTQLRGTPNRVPRTIAAAAVGLAAFVVAFSPQLAAYQALNGRFGPSPLVARKMIWTSPHALEVLLSPAHGFFLWTPLAAFALGGLIWFAVRSRERRQIAWCLVLMFSVAVFVTGSVDSWTAAGAFGQRRFVGLTPLLTVGLAFLFSRSTSRAWRAALLICGSLCVWWNLSLMAQFGARLMDRQRLELRRNAYTSFVTLPKVGPRLAYLYLFDRGSFYQAPPAAPR